MATPVTVTPELIELRHSVRMELEKAAIEQAEAIIALTTATGRLAVAPNYGAQMDDSAITTAAAAVTAATGKLRVLQAVLACAEEAVTEQQAAAVRAVMALSA